MGRRDVEVGFGVVPAETRGEVVAGVVVVGEDEEREERAIAVSVLGEMWEEATAEVPEVVPMVEGVATEYVVVGVLLVDEGAEAGTEEGACVKVLVGAAEEEGLAAFSCCLYS